MGSRGFCTVARTEAMPAALIDRLESLSSYQPALSAEAAAHPSPVLLSHWRVPVGGRTRSVLSRVASCGSDYSGRLNKLAYHLIPEPAEQWIAGPLAMLLHEGVMQMSWTGEPRLLKPGKLPAEAFTAPARLDADRTYHEQDARNLADAFVADATKSACIVYPPEVDPTPLLAGALALLEPRLRWHVTFTTVFSELAAGLTCNWRCAVAGSMAASESARHATSGILIDLSRGR